MPEYVILIDENNHPIGQALKSEVHTSNTPLHRAFSVFLFNAKGQLLLQQRSGKKVTWPLIWSNSCCGHPTPGEGTVDAARRRVEEELGISLGAMHVILPDFRYRAEMNGVVEHEWCPVIVAFSDGDIATNPEEVETVRWVDWKKWLADIAEHPGTYSPWCEEEAFLLEASPEFQRLYAEYTKKV